MRGRRGRRQLLKDVVDVEGVERRGRRGGGEGKCGSPKNRGRGGVGRGTKGRGTAEKKADVRREEELGRTHPRIEIFKHLRGLDGRLSPSEAREELADEDRLHDLEVPLWTLGSRQY